MIRDIEDSNLQSIRFVYKLLKRRINSVRIICTVALVPQYESAMFFLDDINTMGSGIDAESLVS